MTPYEEEILRAAKMVSCYCIECKECKKCIFQYKNECVLNLDINGWSKSIDTIISSDNMNTRVADAAISLTLGFIENGMDTDQAIEKAMNVLHPVVSNQAVIRNRLRASMKGE